MGPDAKPAADDLARALEDPRPDVRREVLIALGHLAENGAAAAPTVASLLVDPDQAVRNRAAFALGRMGPAAVGQVDALRKAMDSKDEMLPTISAWAVARIDPSDKAMHDDAVKRLMAALENINPRVQAAALKGLMDLETSPEVLVPVLSTICAECEPQLMQEIMDILASSGESATPVLIAALARPEAHGRAAVLLERLGPKAEAATPALVAATSDKDPVVRREVLYALGSVLADKGPAEGAIVAALDDPEPQVRATAAYALGRIGPPAKSALPKLRRSVESSDPLVRMVERFGARARGAQDAQVAHTTLPILMHALSDNKTVAVRRGAADALGMLGKAANTAIPALKAAARDPDETVRSAALAALERVGGMVDKSPTIRDKR